MHYTKLTCARVTPNRGSIQRALKEYVIYPNLCANCEFQRNRVIGTVENSFICFHRFNGKIGSVCFISKYILQLNFPAIKSIDEIKRAIISNRKKKKQVHKIFCQNTFFISQMLCRRLILYGEKVSRASQFLSIFMKARYLENN